jgi:hypothetical protein
MRHLPRLASRPVVTLGFLALAATMLAAAAAAQGPVLQFTNASATGVVYSRSGLGDPVPHVVTFALTDTFPTAGGRPPRDTVASHSRLDFAWNATPVPPATAIVSYRYKLESDSDAGVTVDSSVHSVSFNNGPASESVLDGIKVFILRATDDRGHSTEINRLFQMNFAPDTWWSGPDASLVPIVPGSGGQRFVAVADWSAPPAIDGSLFNCDSLHLLPAKRPNRRTFFEIFDDRLYVRSEGDTVHLNSWVFFHNGGFDRDSPYAVYVAPGQSFPQLEPCALISPNVVLQPGPANGSPIGFRSQVRVAPTFGTSGAGYPSETTTYPFFDYGSVFHQPVIAGYWLERMAGRAYAIVRAEDGSGEVDRRVDHQPGDAVGIVDRVENGGATAEDLALRPLILTFYVDRGPIPDFGRASFFPKPPEYNGGQVAISPSRVLQLQYFANDPDPFPLTLPNLPAGGPILPAVFRYTTTVLGRDVNAQLVSVALPPVIGGSSLSQSLNLDTTVPRITGRELTVRLDLCDCDACEELPGSGRCKTFDIPVLLPATLGVGPGHTPVFSLDGLRPNPANGRDASIHFSLAVAGETRLELIDMAGRRVWAQNSRLGPGEHEARVDRTLTPGVYWVRLSHPAGNRSVRVAVLE